VRGCKFPTFWGRQHERGQIHKYKEKNAGISGGFGGGLKKTQNGDGAITLGSGQAARVTRKKKALKALSQKDWKQQGNLNNGKEKKYILAGKKAPNLAEKRSKSNEVAGTHQPDLEIGEKCMMYGREDNSLGAHNRLWGKTHHTGKEDHTQTT